MCANFDRHLMETAMSKAVITITDAEFETEVLKAEQPVLVYFWASWCGPCQLMSPLINSAATKYSDRLKVVKMEIDPNPLTVKQYQVEGVPALRLFQGQEVLISTEGVIGKDKLLELLDTHLNRN
ncbi:trxA, thioredoxin 1 [Nostoc flagelliforme CCNUN1]|uniref:Thioredoxin n=2 Tax=Nostoc flagelliforme TaxID=1306274 RepID=A0A2K8SSN5_9NOSO|nr:trxA, thioredoxin 1 [Nostoc flagelliforme CCNUN1]